MEALGARESAPRFFPPLLACGCSTTFERIAAYCVAGSKCACLRTMHCLTSMRPLPVAFSRFDSAAATSIATSSSSYSARTSAISAAYRSRVLWEWDFSRW